MRPHRRARTTALLCTAALSLMSLESRAEQTASTEPTASTGQTTASVAGWTFAGASLVALALGVTSSAIVASINDDPRMREYRAQVSVEQDACDLAATDPAAADVVELCHRGRTHTILQFLMYGLAAMTAVVSATLFVLHRQRRRSRPSAWLRPQLALSGDGGALGLTGRF